jgi:hypothetical protein
MRTLIDLVTGSLCLGATFFGFTLLYLRENEQTGCKLLRAPADVLKYNGTE